VHQTKSQSLQQLSQQLVSQNREFEKVKEVLGWLGDHTLLELGSAWQAAFDAATEPLVCARRVPLGAIRA
jgi:hypothetical protein